MKFCTKLRKNAPETLQILQEAFKDNFISRSHCGKRNKVSKEGQEEPLKKPHSRRPTMTRTDGNMDCVCEGLCSDYPLGIQQTADKLHMLTFPVHGTVAEDLQMCNVCAKLVPKVLTEDQKKRVSLCQGLLDLIQNESNEMMECLS